MESNGFYRSFDGTPSTKKIHLVRYYGLYSSRTKGKRNKKADEEKAQEKLTTQNNNLDIKNILNYLNKIGNTDNLKNCLYNDQTETMMKKESRKAWARLIQKIYEVNPLVCEKCGCEMRIVVAIFLFCRDPGLGFYSENKRMFEKKVA